MLVIARTNTLRGTRRTMKAFMKTQGEIEAAVGDGISRFEQEHMGRGPRLFMLT